MIKSFSEFISENMNMTTDMIIKEFANVVTNGNIPLAKWFVTLSEQFYQESWMNEYELESCKTFEEIENIVEEYSDDFFSAYEEMSETDDYNYKYFYQMVDFDGFKAHGLDKKGAFNKFLSYYFAIKFNINIK